MAKNEKEKAGARGAAGAGGSAPLQALLGQSLDPRRALNKLREASSGMPGGVAFFDELLAPGVAAACRAGAKLEALDLLYFAGAGRVECVRTLLAAGAPVAKIKPGELVDSAVGGGDISYCAEDAESRRGFKYWSPPWRQCAEEMAAAGLRLRARKGEESLMAEAATRRGEGQLEFLVSIGAAIDERDELGRTVLMTAAQFGLGRAGEKNLLALLALGADPQARDKRGRDARGYAELRSVRSNDSKGDDPLATFDRAMSKWEARELGLAANAGSGSRPAPRL